MNVNDVNGQLALMRVVGAHSLFLPFLQYALAIIVVVLLVVPSSM